MSSQTDRIKRHVAEEYGAEPEFLWLEQSPSYFIYRHANNRKWFALVGSVAWTSLGKNSNEQVEIINLKFGKNQALDFAESTEHVYPAYHMNKRNWITIVLDESLPDEMIFSLIKKSYLLTS